MLQETEEGEEEEDACKPARISVSFRAEGAILAPNERHDSSLSPPASGASLSQTDQMGSPISAIVSRASPQRDHGPRGDISSAGPRLRAATKPLPPPPPPPLPSLGKAAYWRGLNCHTDRPNPPIGPARICITTINGRCCWPAHCTIGVYDCTIRSFTDQREGKEFISWLGFLVELDICKISSRQQWRRQQQQQQQQRRRRRLLLDLALTD